MKHSWTLGLIGLTLGLSQPALAEPATTHPLPAQVAQRVPDHVGRIQQAIRQLRWTHYVIDADAGHNWGGYREKAEVNINSALEELEKAVEYYRVNVAHNSAPYAVHNPNLPDNGGSRWDHMRRIREGIRRLENVRDIVSSEAGTEFGGHREKAAEHIDHAIKHLHDAEDWFHSHH